MGLPDPRIDLESEWESKYTHLNLYWNGNYILNLGGVLKLNGFNCEYE